MNPRASFWKTIPRKSAVIFLCGVFCLFCAIGLVGDVTDAGHEQLARLLATTLLSGILAILYAVSGITLRRQFWKGSVPIFVFQAIVFAWLGRSLPDLPRLVPMPSAEFTRIENRLVFDGVAIMIGIMVGYTCFVFVSITEGRRYARVHAEMLLATEVHRVLVPPINTHLAAFEFCGRSVPSGEVGGDLIDVFPHGSGWIAYIADVSGHGVAPGVVMAMVKSAARMQLSSGESSTALLERMNSVLHPIKKPEMFVTFAYLAWDGDHLEYSVAGHPPILLYRAATKLVCEIACSNLPVAMFGGQQFSTSSIDCEPGDVFLLLTDGLLEVTNDRDEEFGLEAVKAVLAAHGAKPLGETLQAVLDASDRHGRAADDRSLLLVRSNVSAAA